MTLERLLQIVCEALNWASEVSDQALTDMVKAMKLSEEEKKELEVDSYEEKTEE